MPASGISYTVELEWIFAAWRAGYKLEEFRAMEGSAQSEIVAAYQAEQKIRAVLDWENRPKAK